MERPASEWRKRLDESWAQIEAHPGHQAFYDWEGLRRSAAVLHWNHRELDELLEMPRADEDLAIELIQNVRPPDVADDFYTALDVRLHNFVAAAVSLIIHTRVVVVEKNRYKDTRFLAEYEERKQVLANAPVRGFVQDLRNYLLKYQSLPSLQTTVAWSSDSDGFAVEVSIPTETLLTWARCTAPTKQYLEQAGEAVIIRKAVTEYKHLVEELNGWLFSQFPTLHAEELAAVEALRDDFNRLLSGGRE